MLRSRRSPTYALAALSLTSALAFVGCASKVSAPPDPPVAVRLGDAAFEEADYERAIRDYRLYLTEVERGEYTARAFYKSALSAYKLEDYTGALAILDELERRYPGAVWVQVSALRGDALRELGKAEEAVLAWDEAWPLADDIERPKLRFRIATALAGLGYADLDALRKDVDSRPVRALVAQELESRTPPRIDEPMPSAVAAADDAVEPAVEAKDEEPETVLGALSRLGNDRREAERSAAADENVILEAPQDEAVATEEAADAATEEAEAVAAAPVDEERVAAQAPATADDGVARLVRLERPLDTATVVDEEPETESAPAPATTAQAPADDGVVRLQRIQYPGGEPVEAPRDAAPSVDSLEKLDVPADATVAP